MSEDLAVIDQTALTVGRAPEMVLDEAHDAAKALKRVIETKPNKVMFGGEQYLEFEDWQTVGRFYGIAPRIVSSRYVEYGGAQGWEATAEAVHVPTQRVVSSADAMCLNDEEKWSARPKYAWVYHKKSGGTSVDDPGKDELIWEKSPDGKNRPKKERLLVGHEAVPQFQLRSMAQTRAGAKALRNALAWVVVLAGYRPTPAEEMDSGRMAPAAPAVSPPSGETVEAEAQRLFPDEPGPEPGPATDAGPQADRQVLLGKITGCADKLKLKARDRADLWTRYMGQADPRTADVAALQDLLNHLRSVLPEEKPT